MSKRTVIADMTIDVNHLCGVVEFSQREPNGSENVIVIPVEHRNAVAAALTLDPSPASDLTVRIDAQGAAHLRATDGEAVVGITVPRERRREIALELLGGATDELVKRIAGAIGGRLMLRPSMAEVAHDVLNELFGEPA